MITIYEKLLFLEDFKSSFETWERNFFADLKPTVKSIYRSRAWKLLNEIDSPIIDLSRILEDFVYEYDIEDWDPYYDDISELDDDGLENLVEFIKQTINWVSGDIYTNILSNINNHKIKIHRSMKVSDDYIERLNNQGKRIGRYWSYEPSGAKVYWDSKNETNIAAGENVITFISEIDENYIDWNNTIESNLIYDFGHYYDSDAMDSFNYGIDNTDDRRTMEHEITLFKGTPIKIIEIFDKSGTRLDISKIANKTFYA